MAFSTRCVSLGLTVPLLLITAEVVATDTPANRATSRIVVKTEPPPFTEQLARGALETTRLLTPSLDIIKINRTVSSKKRTLGALTDFSSELRQEALRCTFLKWSIDLCRNEENLDEERHFVHFIPELESFQFPVDIPFSLC
jgi:hypothetical protein